jgi:hypothetical protein
MDVHQVRDGELIEVDDFLEYRGKGILIRMPARPTPSGVPVMAHVENPVFRLAALGTTDERLLNEHPRIEMAYITHGSTPLSSVKHAGGNV